MGVWAYNGIKTVSSINDVGRTGLVHAKKMKLDHQLTPYTRINSKWIKDLSVSHETINSLKENIGSKIWDISHSNFFANAFPRARKISEKNLKMWLHQDRILLHSKRNYQQNEKGTHCMGEHVWQWYIQ